MLRFLAALFVVLIVSVFFTPFVGLLVAIVLVAALLAIEIIVVCFNVTVIICKELHKIILKIA
jgi:hypothetical protein